MRQTTNPYRWDLVDPALFYGRQHLAGSLLDRLLAGDRFAVAGGRRMGKTTLLRRLEADLAAAGSSGGLIVVPVFIDVAELYTGSAEDVYGLLARRVATAARAASLPAEDLAVTSGPGFGESLQALLGATRSLGRLQLVFLIDEIERVLRAEWGGGFLAYWRMLLNNMGELSHCVSAVFAEAGPIYQIAQDAGSPLGNILAWQELELFSFEETARLVREPSRRPWPDALVEQVFAASGGQPCLIQYLMQRVCDVDPTSSAESDLSGAQEQAAWSESLASAERRFLREHANVFASWWQGFDEAAQAIYVHLTEGGAASEGDLIARSARPGKRALDVLAHTGVVRWDRGARTVQAAGTLFETWARESALSGRQRAVPGRQRAVPGRQLSRQAPGARSNLPADDIWPTSRAVPAGDTASPGSGRRIGTVLFTDVVSSTRLTAELGDSSWLELILAHNTRVREALAAFQGREVKTMGDGFLALFDAPAAAIECACAIASAVRPLGLEVRAGLHAGEYESVGDDVIGIAISYAAWVMSRARGGEVVVSDTVRALVAGSGIRFVNRGTHRVKGTTERHRLYAVDHDSDPIPPSLP